jgi:transposase
MDTPARTPYPSDVTDDEWAFVSAYLVLMDEAAPQRTHDLRAVFNGVRWIVRTGAPWRMLPHDLPPWAAVYQQTQRWIRAGVCETMVYDLRVLLRVAAGRARQHSAAIFDARTVQSTPESGARGGSDGHKRRKGSTTHLAVDTLGLLLAVHVTAANEQERAQVATLAEAVQEVTGQQSRWPLSTKGTQVRTPKRTPPHMASDWRWSRCPRRSGALCCYPGAGSSSGVSPGWRNSDASRDYERLPDTVAALHFVAFASLMLHRVIPLLTRSA